MADQEAEESEIRYRFSAHIRVPVTIATLVLMLAVSIGGITAHSKELAVTGGIPMLCVGWDLWRQLGGRRWLAGHDVLPRVVVSFGVVIAWATIDQSLTWILVSVIVALAGNGAYWLYLRRRSADPAPLTTND